MVGAQGWKETNRKGAGTRQKTGKRRTESNSKKARWLQNHRQPGVVTFAEGKCKSWGGGEAALQATLAETGGWWLGVGQERGKRTNQPQTEDQQGEWSSSLSARGSGAEIKVLRVQRQGKRGAWGWKEVQRPRSSSALWYDEGGIGRRPSHSSSTPRVPLAARLCRQRISSTWRSSARILASSWAPEARLPVSRLSKA